MPFLVISPGLTTAAKRRSISPVTLAAVDVIVQNAPRRPRPSGAMVWKLAKMTANGLYALEQALLPLADAHQVDIAIVDRPYRWQDYKVLAMDMDSTVITIECIDEIADYCGKKAEVSAITEAAMRGEIKDYAESLRRRVALLKGLPVEVLKDVIRYRLKFTPGVKALVDTARAHGLHTLLVSGGFLQFTDFVSQKIGFMQTRSNQLEIIDGRLTGRLIGEIVDASVKAKTVQEACRRLGVAATAAITVGDGANDLKMMDISGLSIAHRAKPAVAAQAIQAIRSGGLDNVLDWFE